MHRWTSLDLIFPFLIHLRMDEVWKLHSATSRLQLRSVSFFRFVAARWGCEDLPPQHVSAGMGDDENDDDNDDDDDDEDMKKTMMTRTNMNMHMMVILKINVNKPPAACHKTSWFSAKNGTTTHKFTSCPVHTFTIPKHMQHPLLHWSIKRSDKSLTTSNKTSHQPIRCHL